MSKNAILTINIHGDIGLDQISKITIPRMKAYARSVGADFIEWTDLGKNKNRHWKKFGVFELFKEYDRILILNIEVLIKDNAKNIFEIVPENRIGMFNELSIYQFNAKKSEITAPLYMKFFEKEIKNISFDKYWNTGVLLLDKSNAPNILTLPPKIIDSDNSEQTWINCLLLSKSIDVYDIGIEFNCQNPFICRSITAEDIKNASFINITGINKQSTLKGYQIKLGEDRSYFWNRTPSKSKNTGKKLAIYTVCFGEDYFKIGEITLKYMKAYADKIGADFICFDDPPPVGLPSDRFELFHHVLNLKLKASELLCTYDRVLHLDSDILVLPSAPNIFDVVPENQFGIIEEGCMAPDNIKSFEYYIDKYNEILDELGLPQTDVIDWWDKHYNIGVMLASKCHKNIFVKPIEHISMGKFRNLSDVTQAQHHINYMLWLRDVEIYNLPNEYNMMPIWFKNDFNKRLYGFFIHFSLGNTKKKISDMNLLLTAFYKKFPEYER